MARAMCFVFLSAVLTAAFGYPSTVTPVQGVPSSGYVPESSGEAETLPVETDLVAAAADNASYEDSEKLSESSLQDDAPERDSSEDEEDDSDMFMEPQDDDQDKPRVVDTPRPDNHEMAQHFFPSFAPVFSLGHSRPPQLFHQEQYYNKPRSHSSLGSDYNPFRGYRDNSYKVPIRADDDPTTNNILGSGNFGVIKGGTYYNDDDRRDLAGGLFNPYYNNGHGRPYVPNPRPHKYSNGDFFANFRDFADINTQTKTSFSEYVIVYVNKNASRAEAGTPTRPNNIIEQLSMLDQSETVAPEKKTSLHKRKLALMHQEKKNKEKKSHFKKKEPLEPLLALS